MKRTLLLTSAFIFLLLNANSQEFTRIEESAGIDQKHIDEFIMGGGAAFFDYDNDGYLDIYVTGGSNRDKLYHNNQDETFTEVELPFFVYTREGKRLEYFNCRYRKVKRIPYLKPI